MPNVPLISIVIPAYEQGDFIQTCLDSVAAQTYEGALEVIVVDDGSPDDVGRRAREHRLRPRVIRQKNGGVSAARNRGIAESRGEWIAFLDADDRWAPQKLERQINALLPLRRPALSFCRYRRVDSDGNIAQMASDHPSPNLRARPAKLLRQNFIGTSTVLLHRRCLRRCGGFPDSEILRRGGQDYALWLRIAAYFPLVYVPTIEVFYTIHEKNRVGVDSSRHHRAGLAALADFQRWDSQRFRSLSPFTLPTLALWRRGRLLLDLLRSSTRNVAPHNG